MWKDLKKIFKKSEKTWKNQKRSEKTWKNQKRSEKSDQEFISFGFAANLCEKYYYFFNYGTTSKTVFNLRAAHKTLCHFWQTWIYGEGEDIFGDSTQIL